MAQPDDVKICRECGETKEKESHFNKCAANRDGFRSTCKVCHREAGREYYSRNRDKVKASHREDYARQKHVWAATRKAYDKVHGAARHAKWIKAHPEQNRSDSKAYLARKRGAVSDGTVTAKTWKDLCSMYHNLCLKCQTAPEKLTQDHIVPLSKGGEHSIDNIQPLCGPCNSSKRANTVDYR